MTRKELVGKFYLDNTNIFCGDYQKTLIMLELLLIKHEIEVRKEVRDLTVKALEKLSENEDAHSGV